MSHNFSLKYYQDRTLLILSVIIFGFISSKALISIGAGLLLLNLLLSFTSHKFNFVKKSVLPILAGSFFFLSYVLLFPFAENYGSALHQIWTKLPWLIIPWSVAAIGEPKRQLIDFLMSFFVFIIVVSGFVVLINYYSNYAYYTEQIAVAKNIPTPLNHIRYSLMVAFAGILSIYFFIKNELKLCRYDKYFFGFSALFLFLLLHILSIRSGLIAYYAAILYLMLYFSVQSKKWWLLPLVVMILIAMPYFAYHNVKSFHNKVDYMMYDLEQLGKEDLGHNSDARRIQSLQVGWNLIKEKPLIGHGVGSVEELSKNYYETQLPEVAMHNRKVPHNQYLFTTVEMGVVGLLFLLLSIGIPLFSTLVFRHPLYVSLALIFIISCLVENTFESQLGMSIYLVLGSLLLKRGAHV